MTKLYLMQVHVNAWVKD